MERLGFGALRFLVAATAMLMLLLASSGSVDAQARLTLDQVMSEEAQMQTGIMEMSDAQRDALESWLNEWTRYVVTYVEESGSETGVYPDAGSHRYVSSVANSGKRVRLDDWSVWEIASTDRMVTSEWLPTTPVEVHASTAPDGDFGYVLINPMDGQRVYARYVGQ